MRYMAISISNTLFTTNAGTATKPSIQAANSNAAETEETPSKANVGETETTDNIQHLAQNKPVAEVSENFSHTLAKKIAAKNSTDEHPDENVEEQEQVSDTKNPAELIIPQELLALPVVQNISINVKVDNESPQQIEIQASGKSVQLSTESKNPQISSLIAQATQKTDTVSTPENEPIQPAIDQAQIKTETTTPEIFKNSTIESENSKETAADTNVSQAFSDNNKTANESEKTVRIIKQTNESDIEAALSNKPVVISTPPSNPQIGKEAEPQVLSHDNTTAISESTVVTNKSDTTNIPKVQLSDINFAENDNPSTNSQQQVLTAHESDTQTTEKIPPKNTNTSQKEHQGKTEFSDLPGNNKFHIENLPVKPVEQKMSQSQTQPSAAQVDNNNDLSLKQSPVPNTQKMSQSQTQSSAAQLDNNNDSSLKQSSVPDTQISNESLLGNNIPPAITEHSPASATSTKTAGNIDTAASIRSQIQESISTSFHSDGQQIIIRLNPPELGKVAIKFTEQNNGITGLLQVDSLQTKNQIQKEMPNIIQNLQDSGIAVNKIEVVLTNQQEQYTLKDQSSLAGQNSWSGHQSSPNPEPQRNNSLYGQWTDSTDSSAEFSESRLQFTGSSINMLA